MKIIGTEWFTLRSGETIGITVIENGIGEKKAYISVVPGIDEEKDEQFVANHGSPVMAGALETILIWMGRKNG